MPTEYDLSAAFRRIEDELISSMIRNLKRHQAEETAEGFQWSQWQTEQLSALNEYSKANRSKFSKDYFSTLNSKISDALKESYADGESEQEAAILQAIRDGSSARQQTDALTGGFFRTNERKLNALVKATTDDVSRAETAVLRRANDAYRKIIWDAQVYANTGAGTYEKAVDMAAKDFLAAGLQCVEYSNGARHTLSDYADMAIKTASKRAYLQGEGDKRQEWGVSTVIVNKRGNACPKCARFCGKVFIDDVWSGGKRSDGNYPLLSAAIAQGLYHPRCKDSHSTWFPELHQDATPYTKEEITELEGKEQAEQRQQYAQRQAEKYRRMEKYSLDGDNRRKYGNLAGQWEKEVAKGSGSGIIQLRTRETTGSANRDILLSEEAEAYSKRLTKKFDYIEGEVGEFKEDDVRLLSANTGVEYAVLTIEKKSVLIRGEENGTDISGDIYDQLVESKGTLDYHTHPHDGDLIPSPEDRKTIGDLEEKTGQKTSRIISTDGKVSIFNKHGVIETSYVHNTITEEKKKLYEDLFGGG